MKIPIKPDQKLLVEEEIWFDGCATIETILEGFSETVRADFKKIEIFSTSDYEFAARYIKEEPIEEFNERMKKYQKELKEYKEWYNENKDFIKEEQAKNKLLLKQKKLQKQLEEVAKEINAKTY